MLYTLVTLKPGTATTKHKIYHTYKYNKTSTVCM